MPPAKELITCPRCGRQVPPEQYSHGTPGKADEWVSTGTAVQQIPVFQHGSPTMCHPQPVGMHYQTVPTGYVIPGQPEVVWAPGATSADHGCDDCRQVWSDLSEARSRAAALPKEIDVWRKKDEPNGLVAVPPSPSPVSVGHVFWFLALGALTVWLARIGWGMADSPREPAMNALIVAVVPALATLTAGLFLVDNTIHRRRARARAAQIEAENRRLRERFPEVRAAHISALEASLVSEELHATLLEHLVTLQKKRIASAKGSAPRKGPPKRDPRVK